MNCLEKTSYLGTDECKTPVTRKGSVEKVAVGDILLDTDYTQKMVRRELIGGSKTHRRGSNTVKCVHGDNVQYPLADVAVEVEPGALVSYLEEQRVTVKMVEKG